MLSVRRQADVETTLLRCWYRTSGTDDDPASDWAWATEPDGTLFEVLGFDYAATPQLEVFVTATDSATLRTRCLETLGVADGAVDVFYTAADWSWSYDTPIWSTTVSPGLATQPTLDRLVAFGDSLTDTGNFYNLSQWTFPSEDSWFRGRFSNGLVWVEHLAEALGVDHSSWAMSGASGETEYLAIAGVNEQIASFLETSPLLDGYDPARTLFVLMFGLNDLMTYDKPVEEVGPQLAAAISRLVSAGAEHLVLGTLPLPTQAPRTKYADPTSEAAKEAKIAAYNVFVRDQAACWAAEGVDVVLLEADVMLGELLADPAAFGLSVADDSCLDLSSDEPANYLTGHPIRATCADLGSGAFAFWDLTHPSTALHQIMADLVLDLGMPAWGP